MFKDFLYWTCNILLLYLVIKSGIILIVRIIITYLSRFLHNTLNYLHKKQDITLSECLAQTVEKPWFGESRSRVLQYNRKMLNKNAYMWLCFDFHIANFFKFMQANLSLTHFVTWDKPQYGVYRIACFSFASANTLSIFSFRSRYSCMYLSVYLMSSHLYM